MSAPDACGTACGGCDEVGEFTGAESLTGIDRRRFVLSGFLAAAGVALTACEGESIIAPETIGSTVRVADYPALATVGGVALVTISGSQLAIVRTAAQTFLALSRVCPHRGAIVDQSANGFTCPRHGARFSTTGQWTGGERTTNLRSYPTTYDAVNGVITVG